MKGIVFTQFLEMVEGRYSYALVDELLTENQLASGGAYTAIGTYHYNEIHLLLNGLSCKTGILPYVWQYELGQALFSTFVCGYPVFFENSEDSFTFLEHIGQSIHLEVHKLYPDAVLPFFETKKWDNEHFQLTYLSEQHVPDLIEGMMNGCFLYFKESIAVTKEILAPDGSNVRFHLVKT